MRKKFAKILRVAVPVVRRSEYHVWGFLVPIAAYATMPLPLKTRPPKAKRLRIVDPTTVLSRPGPQNQMCKSHGGWKLKGFQILDLRSEFGTYTLRSWLIVRSLDVYDESWNLFPSLGLGFWISGLGFGILDWDSGILD